jgi:hypothetical protein
MNTITVYRSSQNVNRLRLLNDGTPHVFTGLSIVELRLDTGVNLSSETYTTEIIPELSPTGVITLKLGLIDDIFVSRVYTAALLTTEPPDTIGIYWGMFRIRAIEELS